MAELQNNPRDKTYEIKLKGHLNENWADWFDGLTFTHEEDGTTTLTGEIVDQSALHGDLKEIRDLGLPVISVNPAESIPIDQQILKIITPPNNTFVSTKQLPFIGIVCVSKQKY